MYLSTCLPGSNNFRLLQVLLVPGTMRPLYKVSLSDTDTEPSIHSPPEPSIHSPPVATETAEDSEVLEKPMRKRPAIETGDEHTYEENSESACSKVDLFSEQVSKSS